MMTNPRFAKTLSTLAAALRLDEPAMSPFEIAHFAGAEDLGQIRTEAAKCQHAENVRAALETLDSAPHFAICDLGGVLWGVGETPEEAWADAEADALNNGCALDRRECEVYPCTLSVWIERDASRTFLLSANGGEWRCVTIVDWPRREGRWARAREAAAIPAEG